MLRSPLPRTPDNRKDASNIANTGQSVAIGRAAIRDRFPVARVEIGVLAI